MPSVTYLTNAEISASEVSQYSKRLQTSDGPVIIVTEPQASVTEEELHNLVSEIDSLEKDGNISEWEDDFIPEEIIQLKPKLG